MPIFKEFIEVTNRLSELGTARELLLEVIDAVVAAKADCTDFDPFGARGWRGWQMGTRRNREVHVGLGDWQKDDTDQVPSIVSKSLGIRIVVCNTDDATAIEDKVPQNSSKKGSATLRAVDVNQFSLFEDLEKPDDVHQLKRELTSAGAVVTYYLCVYSNVDDRRGELSCPVNVENGFFEDFMERIFITGGDTGPVEEIKRKKGGDDGDGAEYPISVTRKK